MQTTNNDALLKAAKVLIYIVLGILALSAVAVTAGAGAFIIFGTEFAPDVVNDDLPTHVHVLIVVMLLAVTCLLAMGWFFFRKMLRIVQSVGEGDPFVPANADRLTAMAWIMLAINIASLPLLGLGIYIAKTVGEDTGTVDAGIDPGGIILVLTLFILARVFRQGTAMRDDLEGTV